jgi:hypothetical protein
MVLRGNVSTVEPTLAGVHELEHADTGVAYTGIF